MFIIGEIKPRDQMSTIVLSIVSKSQQKIWKAIGGSYPYFIKKVLMVFRLNYKISIVYHHDCQMT